jgi:cbb3-type cytochrome oxidase maturation protein
MEIVILMIPIALLLGLGFLGAFLWANRNGQFDDLVGPSHRMVFDDDDLDNRRTHEQN